MSMGKQQSLTVKRILKKHKENPRDKKLHTVIEHTEVAQNEFLGLLKKAVTTKPQKHTK